MIRGREKFFSKVYMVSDVFVILLMACIAWYARFVFLEVGNVGVLPRYVYFLWSIVYSVIFITIGFLFSLYISKRKKRFRFEVLNVLRIHGASLFILLGLMYFTKSINLSRLYLLLFFVFSIFGTLLFRLVVKLSLNTLRNKGYNKQFVLIVGTGIQGRNYCLELEKRSELGMEVVGVLENGGVLSEKYADFPEQIIGGIDDLDEVLENHIVDEVVIALSQKEQEKLENIIRICDHAGVQTTIIPDFFSFLSSKPYIDSISGIPIIYVRDVQLHEIKNLVLKRLFDFAFSVIALCISLPFTLLIALFIKLTSSGPVIFKQERVGLNRRKFTMYKFRTLKLKTKDESDTTWTVNVNNNKEISKFGLFLRRTGLDEIPQFFNVLKGDMSVIGPRAERPFFVNQFKTEVPQYMVKHQVRPGITGWAQVNGLRGDTSISERINFDIYYIENWSILLDLKILIMTLLTGFKGNGE